MIRADRPNNMVCGQCYFAEKPQNEIECHRNAPTPTNNPYLFPIGWTDWPHVRFHDWCGEWKEGKT